MPSAVTLVRLSTSAPFSSLAARFTQLDYDREMVFIANAPKEDGEGEETLGTVRTWTDADNLRCEFAVMVDDKMKGEGLGLALMRKMIDYCRSRGTVEMVGSVGQQRGDDKRRFHHGAVILVRPAPRARPTRLEHPYHGRGAGEGARGPRTR